MTVKGLLICVHYQEKTLNKNCVNEMTPGRKPVLSKKKHFMETFLVSFCSKMLHKFYGVSSTLLFRGQGQQIIMPILENGGSFNQTDLNRSLWRLILSLCIRSLPNRFIEQPV